MFTLWPKSLTKAGETIPQWETRVRAMDLGDSFIEYLVFQQEIAPNPEEGSDGLHIQGYVKCTDPKRAGQLAVQFDCLATVFQRSDGSPAHNKTYCTKADTRKAGCTFYEYGEIPGGQGGRTDLKRAADLIGGDGGLEAAIEALPATYIQYSNGMKALDQVYKSQKLKSTIRDDLEVCVAWGTAGSGKSHWAETFWPGQTYTLPVSAQKNTTWFDNYSGEKVLVIEDFEGKIEYGSLKRILDRYPMQAQVKGGHVWAEWNYVIITSNTPPQRWYDSDKTGDHWTAPPNAPGALQRRIGTTMRFTGTHAEGNVEIWVDDETEARTSLPTHADLVAATEPESEPEPDLSGDGLPSEEEASPTELNSAPEEYFSDSSVHHNPWGEVAQEDLSDDGFNLGDPCDMSELDRLLDRDLGDTRHLTINVPYADLEAALGDEPDSDEFQL